MSGPSQERIEAATPTAWRYRNLRGGSSTRWHSGKYRWHYCDYDPTDELAAVQRPSHWSHEIQPLFAAADSVVSPPTPGREVAEALRAGIDLVYNRLPAEWNSVNAPIRKEWLAAARAALAVWDQGETPQ